MRVVVVGGGIGGLALGAGLRRRGYEVAVFDRDNDVAATGGYHITLDERAQSALRELVAPQIMRRLLASASALRLRDRDAFWDRRGRSCSVMVPISPATPVSTSTASPCAGCWPRRSAATCIWAGACPRSAVAATVGPRCCSPAANRSRRIWWWARTARTPWWPGTWREARPTARRASSVSPAVLSGGLEPC